MKLTVKYYGMVAEITNKDFEDIVLDNNEGVFKLKDILQKKYKKLSLVNYKIAVNKKLEELDIALNEDAEVALLPPFAGG